MSDFKKPIYTDKGAVFSGDKKYRYLLWRTWGKGKPLVFAMLNPSVANGEKDDPTITKSVGFACRLGYSGILVVNAFALCSTDPKKLLRHLGDRVGPRNEHWLRTTCAERDVVVGWGRWGSHAHLVGFVHHAREIIKDSKPELVRCFGRTKDGEPAHPLMLPYSSELSEFAL